MTEIRYDLPVTEVWSIVYDPFTDVEHRHPVNLSKCECHVPSEFGMCRNCAHFYARQVERWDSEAWAPVVELNRKAPPVYKWGLRWSWLPLVAVRYCD